MTLSELAERMADLLQTDRDWLGEEMIRLMQNDENGTDFGLSDEGLSQLEKHLEVMENGEFVAPFFSEDEEDEIEPRPKKWKIKSR